MERPNKLTACPEAERRIGVGFALNEEKADPMTKNGQLHWIVLRSYYFIPNSIEAFGDD